YLLKKEIEPFLNLSHKRAEQLIEAFNQGDFTFFHQLDHLFVKAIQRAHVSRAFLKAVLLEKAELEKLEKISRSDFALDEKELFLRQKNHLLNFYFSQKRKNNLLSDAKKDKLFQLFEKKLSRFESEYTNQAKVQKEHYFVLHLLKAFARSLDAHSAFFSEEEAQEMRVSLEKQFEGIGVVLTESIDGVQIAELISNSPAKRSGKLQAGDLIVEINHRSIENLTFDEVLQALKTKEQGEIVLGLKRGQSNEVFSVALQSEPIEMQEERLTYSFEEVEGGIIGKLVLKSFYENSDGASSEREIKSAIDALRKKGQLKGLILDLRENAGGFLSQAIKVVSLFIESGVVVVSKYGEELKYIRKIEGSAYYQGPLIVLTSKLSASASEIVAQALQDYGVALIVGDKTTFGKGSIQYQTVTAEKSDYFYKVTIGKYYTVSGKSTQINGVRADIVVPSFYAPFDIGERFLEYALSADSIHAVYADTLADLEPKLKALLEKRYLPTLQKKVTVWEKQLPELRAKSEKRLAASPLFKNFLSAGDLKEAVFALDDSQMQETVNILKDMLEMQKETMAAVSD
ncbi:MAG: S41 family peptidase, partial [Parachlamydiales bacterium]